jgi:aspartyl-tRNA(Asn)/glutamyl-tRNA(Gln) amidotransferase subunit A
LENYKNIEAVQAALRAGETTCVNLVKYYFQQIEDNKHLNAYVEVFKESAMQKAEELDAKIKSGASFKKLTGVVVGIKDNLCFSKHKVSASSKILEGFESLYSATAVKKMVDEEAIIIGRLSCDEFAMGGSNENSYYGKALNPIDNTKVPGGSSGGSAVAVAANLCMVALGTDTGGSIRQPASFCGVVGLKPTYGRVSRYGCIAYASSFDQIGPIANTIEDTALLLEVISGADDNDSTVSSKQVPEYSSHLSTGGSKFRVAYLNDCLNNDGLDSEIKSNLETTINKLKADGHKVEGVDFPFLDYMVPAYYILTTAEASSNLSRYDGVHYGYRSPNATDLETTYTKSRTEGFGKEVKRRIMLGAFVLSAGYYDAYYSKAQKVRRIIQEKTQEIFKDYDFIVLPTAPSTAFEFGLGSEDPVRMYLEDIFTVQANLAGIPSISLPLGKHSNGLPFGVQVMANRFEEANLLAFSKYMMN